jgi:molybdate-binding protein/DNA-binding XRE family transcriptional regulator
VQSGAFNNRVKAYRIARGWSQEDLVRRSGVSRSGISAIETGRLVPSAAAALALAAAFDCRVEDVFSIGGEKTSAKNWAWPPRRDPCLFWQAEVNGQHLLYPVEPPQLGLIGCDGTFAHGEFRDRRQTTPSDTLVLACCDPAAALLAARFAQRSGFRLLALQRSSGEALTLLQRGMVHVAGVHFARADRAEANADMVRERLGAGYQLLHIATWEEGVALTPTLGLRTMQAALSAKLRWVGREAGSAARQRLDELLGERKPPRRVAYDHRGVAEAIRCGWADAGMCHRMVSEEIGLDFIGFEKESFDLCWSSGMDGDPRIQALVATVRSSEYRDAMTELPGFETSRCGERVAVE